jgi:hypothetical protein
MMLWIRAAVTGSASPYHRTPFRVQAWQPGLGKRQHVNFARYSSRALVATAACTLLGMVASGVAGAQGTGDPHVLKIVRCFVTKPRPFSHRPTGTQIDFVNTGPLVLHDITFQIAYRNGDANITRTFDDVGTFAPNEPIDHHFDAFTDVQYAGPEPTSCLVAGVR